MFSLLTATRRVKTLRYRRYSGEFRGYACMDAALGWADLELLERIRTAGTLGGAARSLGVDQTTASRRLATLERRAGAKLFARIEGRLVPTPPLASIADRLRTISELATVSSAILNDGTVKMHGNVRVTSVGFLLANALAPALGAFQREHPGVCIEFIADDRSLSFERREADVAARLGATAEDSTRIRRLGNVVFRLCRPTALRGESANELPVVRYRDDLLDSPEMRALELARPVAIIAFKSNRLDVLIEAALALGAEIMLPERVAQADPRFKISDVADTTATRPLFLMTHPDRAQTPSVAATASWVAMTARRWLQPKLAAGRQLSRSADLDEGPSPAGEPGP